MNRRVGALILGIAALTVATSGCGDKTPSTEVWLPKNSPALDRQIAELNRGMSVESVKARLGKPLSENTVDEGNRTVAMLFYGRWQLLFDDGKLDRRVKYVFERPIPKVGVDDQKERALDRRVLALRPGMPMGAIKSRLGVPDTFEIDRNDPEEITLSYKYWRLAFVNGVLKLRNRY